MNQTHITCKYGITRVHTFTYGVKGSPQNGIHASGCAQANTRAETLSVPGRFVSTRPWLAPSLMLSSTPGPCPTSPGQSLSNNIEHWLTSASSASVLEALVRGDHRPKSADEHRNAAAAVSTLVAVTAVQNPATLPACFSLAGTAHKLLQQLMQIIATCRSMGQHTAVADVESMEACIRNHLVGRLHFLNTETGSAHPKTALSESALCTGDAHANTDKCRSGAVDNSKWLVLLKQLRAVITLSVLQFEGFLVQVSGKPVAVSRPKWLKVLGEQDAELADIVWQQLSNQRSTMQVRLLGMRAWEDYTLRHFHGRLLPGCCFVRCTKLAGVSEAALQTWLCSGCRRVRYCSEECRKAAWFAGGHSLVCGQGGWTASHHC